MRFRVDRFYMFCGGRRRTESMRFMDVKGDVYHLTRNSGVNGQYLPWSASKAVPMVGHMYRVTTKAFNFSTALKAYKWICEHRE